MQLSHQILGAGVPVGVHIEAITRQRVIAALPLHLAHAIGTASDLAPQLGDPQLVGVDLAPQCGDLLAVLGAQRRGPLGAASEPDALTLDLLATLAKLGHVSQTQELLDNEQLLPRAGELVLERRPLDREFGDLLARGAGLAERGACRVQLAVDARALPRWQRRIPAAVQPKPRTEKRLEQLVGGTDAAAVGRTPLDRRAQRPDQAIRVNHGLDRHLEQAARLAVVVELEPKQPASQRNVLPLTADRGREVLAGVGVVDGHRVAGEVPDDAQRSAVARAVHQRADAVAAAAPRPRGGERRGTVAHPALACGEAEQRSQRRVLQRALARLVRPVHDRQPTAEREHAVQLLEAGDVEMLNPHAAPLPPRASRAHRPAARAPACRAPPRPPARCARAGPWRSARARSAVPQARRSQTPDAWRRQSPAPRSRRGARRAPRVGPRTRHRPLR